MFKLPIQVKENAWTYTHAAISECNGKRLAINPIEKGSPELLQIRGVHFHDGFK